MRKATLLLSMLFFLVVTMFSQTLIAGWDFQTTTNGGTAVAAVPNCPSTLVANVGTGTLYLNGTNGSSTWVTATTNNEVTAVTGSSLNVGTGMSSTTSTPAALSLLGGTSNAANGKAIVFKFSMTGQNPNLVVSYATQKSSTGFSSQTWYYSTNGIDWTLAQTISTIPTSYAVTTLNTISALANATDAYLKVVFTGATASNGSNRIDNVQLNAIATPIASTPTFSPTAGNVIVAQNVTISTTTPSAIIYYTVDGSTPTTSSLVYSTPITVSSTTTLKAIATASGYDNSAVGSATFTFPTTVANLGALNAATHPGFYKVTGEAVLTLKSSTRNAKYFQDNSGGVLIDDNSGVITSSMSAGDGVTGLIGTTAYYNGMLQFTPFDNSAIVTSSGKSITPQVVSLANLSLYPAQLVKVEGVTITGTGNFASSTSYDLNSSSTAVLRTQYADLDYVASAMAIPTVLQDITGVVLIYTTTAQIVPRSSADFANSVATKLNGLNESNIIAFAQNGSVSVKASEGQNVQIFNSMGQQILNKQAIEGLNVYAINKQGVFVVKVGDKVAKVQL